MSAVPSDLKYTKEHEWIQGAEGATNVKIGITDFAQSALGDIVYIQLPKVGQKVVAGGVCGEVESTKSVSEIFAPVSGTVIAVNADLETAPEVINSDPYGAGWIAEIELDDQSEELLTATEYETLIA